MDARRKRSCDCEIAGRFLQANSANNIQENIELREGKSGALVEHCEEKSESPAIVSCRNALRRSKSGLRCQSLNLDQHRARSFEQRGDCTSGRMIQTIAEK